MTMKNLGLKPRHGTIKRRQVNFSPLSDLTAAGYASPFTPISIEITQSGLPGSGVHYVMTGWFPTPGFNMI